VPKSPKSLKWDNLKANKSWNYKEGDTVMVEVPTNLHKAELVLNGKSLGWRSLSNAPDRILRWAVPFKPGTLMVRGGFDGNEIAAKLSTTSKPTAIKITTDAQLLSANGYDVAHIIAQLIDEKGLPVTTEEATLTFDVNGDVKILGVDNGSNRSTQDYQTNKVVTSKGRALLLVQSIKGKSANVKIKVSSSDLNSNEIQIRVNR
jgi:hypothetical protein